MAGRMQPYYTVWSKENSIPRFSITEMKRFNFLFWVLAHFIDFEWGWAVFDLEIHPKISFDINMTVWIVEEYLQLDTFEMYRKLIIF